jgi:uncharacterized protein YqgV (UPF0045/DUF77 family)
MMTISAQISLYPLGTESYASLINEAIRKLERPGLAVQVGSMSTVVKGEETVVFAALQELMHAAAEQSKMVAVITISNACGDASRRDEKAGAMHTTFGLELR